MIDIGLGTLFKLWITGVTTYIVMPFFLIIRDWLLWKYINRYILNKELDSKIDRYTTLLNLWNTRYAVTTNVKWEKGTHTTYTIDGAKVTHEKYIDYENERQSEGQKISNELNDIHLYLFRKAGLIRRIIKHYKQELSTPIDNKIKISMERFKKP